MIYVYLLYAALLGLIIGSFLNVVILRLHSGRTVAGRSFCMTCTTQLAWYDMVPVLSFIFLQGKCRRCRTKISWQYPSVELLTSLLYICSAYVFFSNPIVLASILTLIFRIIIWPILIVILFYDFRHKIIPDGFVYAFALLALVYRIALGCIFGFNQYFFSDVLTGPLLFTAFFLLWFLSEGKWMGFGDAKLVLGMGFWLGFGGGISATIFGFWAGAIVGIVLIALSALGTWGILRKIGMKQVTLKSELPFGPFLILGVLVVEFLHFSLFNLWL
jgi:leader peptidase (prepilin peptidase)/N-methyltransferase